MDFSSKLLESAVNEMAQLPGIGKRTALRLVLHLLKQPKEQTSYLAEALKSFRDEIKLCKNCHNISDVELCEICTNTRRDPELICVVEDIRDVMAIENTSQFKGLYHVLGGKISPIEGIGPHNLTIENLVESCSRFEDEMGPDWGRRRRNARKSSTMLRQGVHLSILFPVFPQHGIVSSTEHGS